MTIQDIIRKYRPGFVLERTMVRDLEALERAAIARFCHENGLETVFRRVQAREKAAEAAENMAGEGRKCTG